VVNLYTKYEVCKFNRSIYAIGLQQL